MKTHLLGFALIGLSISPACAQDSDLARKLANPVAALISVPFQSNYDCCTGPLDAGRYTLNIQPVVPVKLNPDWNLIVRTILPVISAQSPSPATAAASGLGDTTQSFFLSPNAPTNGIIWGVGPVFLYPTATSDVLGAGRWGAGPTAVVLKQDSGWTYGALANHIWSFADARDGGTDVNSTYLQPFVNYTFPSTFGITLNTESTYNWITQQWSVPVNLMFSHIVKFGKLPVSLQAGPRYYLATSDDGPRWGVRFNATLLFPAH